MQVLIIEDEAPAANRLAVLLRQINHEINIADRLDSIESSVKYLQKAGHIDLVFMDIQLADGLSFDIFQQATVTMPVIFTTAFDQYAIKAFKVNSIDYLLKPIDKDDLQAAIEKYQQLYTKKQDDFSEKILRLMREMNATTYTERLLIKRGLQLTYLKTAATAYAYADGKLCYAVDFDSNKFLLETNLGQLEEQLHPGKFYRINRNLLVNIESILKVHSWMGGRLKLELSMATHAETVVSRERVSGFKTWLGR